MLSFILLFHFSFAYCTSQTNDNFSAIDSWVSKQNLSDTSIHDLTLKLISPAKNDREKIRAIFQFVVRFLTYDHRTSGDRRRINQNIYDIIERKKGICWDYAQLISHMAGIAGLSCYTVAGFSKDIENSRPINPQPDHAWNLIKLEKAYYLLDATWESNTINNPDRFKSTYQTDYFLTEPLLFIKGHFPAIPAFQLLSCPLTFQEFSSEISMEKNPDTCFINFNDTIDSFLTLSYADQKIEEAKAIYQSVPNEKNESSWGHALIDKGIWLKESGDLIFEAANHSAALPYYEEAFFYFSAGSDKTVMYPWQKESYAFCHLNFAQILYRIYYEKGQPLNPVTEHLLMAKNLLEQLETSSVLVKSALAQIEYQLSAIE